jgi:hypothetical protein
MQRDTQDWALKKFQDPKEVSFQKLLASWLPIFEEANTGLSLGAYLRLKYGEHASYVEMTIDASTYHDARTFFLDWQCLKLFSKFDRLNTGINTTRVAMKEFIRCEQKCRQLNQRIRTFGFPSLFNEGEWPIIYRATRIIKSIIGVCPEISTLDCHFGPGGNVGLNIRKTSSYDKLSAARSITADLSTILKLSSFSAPRWDSFSSSIDDDEVVGPFSSLTQGVEVPGSRLSFVPKNAKTDRPICIEPLINSFVQTGYGKVLRRRLFKAGVNLKHQTVNQELARIASIADGTLATIDLKSASDLISYDVVKELLPYDWFFMLAVCRSPCYTYEDQTYPMAKFSSMGNGYTFELESLIFYAICQAVKEHNGSVYVTSVYGDDLIAPCSDVPLIRSLLEKLGFEVSESKSFSSGPFRESCGKDYFKGVNVRPYFQKTGSFQAVMSGHNHVARRNSRCFSKIASRLKSLLPMVLRNYGPDGYGDGHLISQDYVPNRDKSLRFRQLELVSFKTVQSLPIRWKIHDGPQLAYALYKGAYGAREVPRTTTPDQSKEMDWHNRRDAVRYKTKRVHLPWCELVILPF